METLNTFIKFSSDSFFMNSKEKSVNNYGFKYLIFKITRILDFTRYCTSNYWGVWKSSQEGPKALFSV